MLEFHLLAALSVVAAQTHAAPTCTAARQVVERFISADCESCWGSGGNAAAPRSTWVLDWIAPTERGAEAPLAAVALPEAGARLAELGSTAPPDAAREHRWRLPAKPAVHLRVAGGPAWNGYLGLELRSRGKPPAGAVAYLALVEELPAGSEGTPVERRLLRAVAGPLALDASGRTSTQLRALRLPEGARPERIQGVAWWVDANGQLGGIAREGCPRPAR